MTQLFPHSSPTLAQPRFRSGPPVGLPGAARAVAAMPGTRPVPPGWGCGSRAARRPCRRPPGRPGRRAAARPVRGPVRVGSLGASDQRRRAARGCTSSRWGSITGGAGLRVLHPVATAASAWWRTCRMLTLAAVLRGLPQPLAGESGYFEVAARCAKHFRAMTPAALRTMTPRSTLGAGPGGPISRGLFGAGMVARYL